MVTTVFLIAAAGLSIPSPIDKLSTDDYPSWAVRDGVSGGGIIHVVVDPLGKVTSCEITSEIGDARLAKSVCTVISRKRHRPATLRSGQAVHAVIDTIITFNPPDTEHGRKMALMRRGPDAELTVSNLPAGEHADVSVLLAFDQAGKVADCAPAEDAKLAVFAKLACDQRAIFDGAVLSDGLGQPVAYVTRKSVRFTLSPVS